MNNVEIRYGGTYNVPLPFKVPSQALVQLKEDKKQPKYPGLAHDSQFRPFIDNTGLKCEKLYNDNYLFVLDFDYEDKWDHPIFQDFKYNETYTRETNHGLHLYYFSPAPCDIIQDKSVKIDLRRTTTGGAKNGLHGNFVVYYPRPHNNLPVMEIDCNEVVAELYESNGLQVRHYGDKKIYTRKHGQYVLKNSEIQPHHIAIAEYLKNLNNDWNHGYDLSFKWGLQLGGVLDDEIEAEAIATALMNNVEYPHKHEWVINFVNGYLCSDKPKFTNIGTWVFKYPELVKMKNKLNEYELIDLKEFVEDFQQLKLEQFIKLARSVKKWETI